MNRPLTRGPIVESRKASEYSLFYDGYNVIANAGEGYPLARLRI